MFLEFPLLQMLCFGLHVPPPFRCCPISKQTGVPYMLHISTNIHIYNISSVFNLVMEVNHNMYCYVLLILRMGIIPWNSSEMQGYLLFR